MGSHVGCAVTASADTGSLAVGFAAADSLASDAAAAFAFQNATAMFATLK